MEASTLFFWDLFSYLREEGKVELDLDQYEAFLHLFLSDAWKKDQSNNLATVKKTLKNLCISLWIPKQKYLPLFNDYFDKYFNDQLYKYIKADWEGSSSDINNSANIDKTKEEEEIEKNDETKPLKNNTSEPTGKQKTEDATAEIPSNPTTDLNQPFLPTRDLTMYVNISEGKDGSANEAEQGNSFDVALATPFIFSDEKHLPITNRKGLQLWRKLNTVTQRIEGDRISIKNTVKSLAKNQVLYRPSYELEKKGKIDFILFIEHDGPMVAFKSWWQQLIQHLKNSNKNNQVAIYYFTNYPLPAREKTFVDFHLFTSSTHTHSKTLSELRKDIGKNTNILFFSDAGALDNKPNQNRVQYTWQFIQQLQNLTQHIVWLNPLPAKKWENTAASFLSLMINMETYNFKGIENGVKKLRE